MRSHMKYAQAYTINPENSRFLLSSDSKVLILYEVLVRDAGFYFCCENGRAVKSFFVEALINEPIIKELDRVMAAEAKFFLREKHMSLSHKQASVM